MELLELEEEQSLPSPMSMGMLMLPPVLISLPFKILLFVLVDGWHLVVRSLAGSFAA